MFSEYELLLAEYDSKLTNEWEAEKKGSVEDQNRYVAGSQMEAQGLSTGLRERRLEIIKKNGLEAWFPSK
jgi:hypothetical protein